MTKMTFVIEFEPGKEPSIEDIQKILVNKGKLLSYNYFDLRDDHLSHLEADQILDALEDAHWRGTLDDETASLPAGKLELITQ